MNRPPESNWLRFGIGISSLAAGATCFWLAWRPEEFESAEFIFVHLLLVIWGVFFLRAIRLRLSGRAAERFGQGPMVLLILVAFVLFVVAFHCQRMALERFEGPSIWKWIGAVAGVILSGGVIFSVVGLLRSQRECGSAEH